MITVTKKFRRILLFVLTLSLSLSGADCEGVNRIPADSPLINYFGRWEIKDGVAKTGQGATYIKVNFTGDYLAAEITGNDIYWQVSVDGHPFKRYRINGKKNLVLTDDSTKNGEHSLILVRSTEGEAGISEFKGFVMKAGGHLVECPDIKTRRLEFTGDSITAGALNLGSYEGEGYHKTEDGNMAFGPELSRLLNAEWSVVAKSGGGLIHNYADTWPSDKPLAIDRYGWTFFYNRFSPDNLSWDAKNFPVDGVIIAIGTNDFTDPDRKPTEEEFVKGYEDLIVKVRTMNPTAKIICLEPVPSWLPAEVRDWINTAVKNRRASGDKKVYCIMLNETKPLLSAADYTDGTTHPNERGTIKIAAYLKDKVAAIMEWD